jgi:His-Xaa-Ser system protein HxsD
MPTNVTVEFPAATQSLGALQAAAYRLIGLASCEIDQTADHWVCRLTPIGERSKRAFQDGDSLRTEFLDLVADENLRERIHARTEGVRNVILALAFGSLAKPDNHR